MDDLIRREDAIDAVIEWYGCEPSDLKYFKTIIEKKPSADRPQGEWKVRFPYEDTDKVRTCSNCNVTQTVNVYDGIVRFKFCPYCGVRMKEENI